MSPRTKSKITHTHAIVLIYHVQEQSPKSNDTQDQARQVPLSESLGQVKLPVGQGPDSI